MQHSAIITGAISGLGIEITKELLKNNYKVFGITKTKASWEKALQLTNHNKNLQLNKLNITSLQNVSRYIKETFTKNPKINLIINNAGYISNTCKLEDVPIHEFNKIIKTNLYSVFYICKFAIPYLLKNTSSLIVNISSFAGKRAVPYISAYSAAKFGVLALSQSIAKENQNSNLKCFSVCPGGINTNMRNKVFGDADLQQPPEFVAKTIIQAIKGEINIESGGDIIIRKGEITINPAPTA